MVRIRSPLVRAPRLCLALAVTGLLVSAWTRSSAAQPLTFGATHNYATGSEPYLLAMGDLNGDGRPDVVTANFSGGSGNSVSVLLNAGSGVFSPHVDYATGGAGASSVAIGDVNGDGKPDLAVANLNASTVGILLGNGDGTFGLPTGYASGAAPYSVVLADLNGDGKLDLVTADGGAGTVSVRLGDGLGGFGSRTTFPTASVPIWVSAQDLNGDGKPDLVVANFSSNSVSVLRGNGDGTFAAKVDYATGSGPYSLVLADFNGDGKADLAVANEVAATVSVMLGDGAGGFGARTDLAANANPIAITAADLNGDGFVDLAVDNYNSAGTVSVFLGNGGGGFAARTDYGSGGGRPKSLVIADLDGDSKRDVVVANQSSSIVSVLFNTSKPGSATSLSAAPNPSSYGQAVTFTANVNPTNATGSVTLLDGTGVVSSATLSGGMATCTISNLSIGSHSMSASYGGDATYAASASTVVTLVVNRAASTTSLSSSANPSLYQQPVHFMATVSLAGPGAANPTGSVQFKIDGANFGAAKGLVAGSATSDDTPGLAVGLHTIEALYTGDNNFLPGSAPTLTQTVTFSTPAIVAVQDVPHDQGGHAFVSWRMPLDQPGIRVVTGYRIWRRAVSPIAAAGRATAASAANRAPELRRIRTATPAGTQETFWEAIATLPAEQLISYVYDAPTTQDSIAGSNPYTAFFVTALTADPYTFFESSVDSGYSVDNLAPPTPSPFVGVYGPSSTALHWGPNRAADLREFRLYRGNSSDFVPGPGNLLAATRDTAYMDAETFAFYKLVAVDIHGNVSRVALVSPAGPVATLVTVISLDALLDRILVTWYTPGNVGGSATVYRRTETTDWAPLAQIGADGLGYMRYEDRTVVAGTRYGYRLGIQDGDAEVFGGEVWATAENPAFALDGVRPNPSNGSALHVEFVLPSEAPARLELFDIAGRRVASRDVGSYGPGLHTVDLEQGIHLRSGMYVVRLTQGGHTATTRAVAIE